MTFQDFCWKKSLSLKFQRNFKQISEKTSANFSEIR